jgi:hypothetical protein
VTEPRPPDPEVEDRAASREAVDRLLEAHGVELYRYCTLMLGPDGAALLPTILGHLHDHAGQGVERLVALAVAHNRCIERSRTGGRPPSGQGLQGPVAVAVRALAPLKPVGRDAMVLRSVLGLRWSELERVCGAPPARMIERVCRAWRNMVEVAEGGTVVRPGPRAAGRPLVATDEAFAAIRDDARRFVALRDALREAAARESPAPGWSAALWQQLELERQAQRHLAQERAAERAAAQAAREAREARAAREAQAAERAASPPAGAFTSATSEAEAEDAAPPRARSLRWVVVGVALALVGVAARWLMMP